VDELARVVRYYPSYKRPHRAQLLRDLFESKSQAQMVAGKISAKGLDEDLSAQSKGGHGKWVIAKIRKTTIRLLYLRSRLDEGLPQKRANNKLLHKFTKSSSVNAGQSSIRKATGSRILSAELKK